MTFCGVATRAIPWFKGFLGLGLLAFKIRLPDFEKFSLTDQDGSVLPQFIPLLTFQAVPTIRCSLFRL